MILIDIKTVAVSKLLLDLENPRFPDEARGQRAAINLMLELQEEKIVRLAKDIAAKGMDPSENLMVYKSSEEVGFFVVAEGNRRTTALKLLAHPELAEKDRIRKIFIKIKDTAIHNVTRVNCVIFDDESYEHWVSLKHTGDNKGVGRERWTTPEADRYQAKHGKSSYQNQLYDFILMHEKEYEDILLRRKFIYATNLSRLFGDKSTRGRFGLVAVDGKLYSKLPYQVFLSNFRKVLENMTEIEPGKSKPEFNVKRIYTVDNRSDYLTELGIEIEPELQAQAWLLTDPKPVSTGITNNSDSVLDNQEEKKNKTDAKNGEQTSPVQTAAVSGSGVTSTPVPKLNRSVLIPASVKLHFGVNDKKCAQIFRELKSKMSHDDAPFSIAVMLRVFLDLSVSALIEKKGLKSKDPTRTPGLHDKVVMCCNFLKEQKKLTGAQASSICAVSKDKLNAKGTIQQYVHNQHQIPTRDIVNGEWDNFQPLFEALWSPEIQK